MYQRTFLSALVILPLGRESIYLADRIFLDAMSNGKAIILEKTMTTYSQVCPRSFFFFGLAPITSQIFGGNQGAMLTNPCFQKQQNKPGKKEIPVHVQE